MANYLFILNNFCLTSKYKALNSGLSIYSSNKLTASIAHSTPLLSWSNVIDFTKSFAIFSTANLYINSISSFCKGKKNIK